MQRRKYAVSEDGFSGTLYVEGQPETGVIILSDEFTDAPNADGIARTLARSGFAALAVRLWGTDDLPVYPDRIPANRIESAVRVLRVIPMVRKIVLYACSLGTAYAVPAAVWIPEIRACALISPLWSAFEGILSTGQMSGHSAVIWKGQELPYVRAVRYAGAFPGFRQLFTGFEEQWKEPGIARATDLHPERILSQGKPLLMMAGGKDEYWSSWQVTSAYARRLGVFARQGLFTERIYMRCGHCLGIVPESLFHLPFTGVRGFSVFPDAVKERRLRTMEMKEAHLTVLDWLTRI